LELGRHQRSSQTEAAVTKRPFQVVHREIKSPSTPERSPTERPAYTPKQRENPLHFAQHWLGPRLEERGEHGAYLDGRPAKLDALMREANRVAREAGADMLLYKPEWRPC
jgi:hypothetical protein